MNNVFLETERLIIRKMNQSDFDAIAVMLKNPRIMYAWEYSFEDTDVTDWINKNIKLYEKFNLGFFLAINKFNSEVVGQVALMPDSIDGKEYYEIGYILNEKYWHQGFASEGAKAMVDYAFVNLNLSNVIFEIRPENLSSRKVAERLGAKITGSFDKNVRGISMKHLIYTLGN